MSRPLGIALITLLIFLQILMLLSLLIMQIIWLQTKESRLIWQRHTLKIIAEGGLAISERGLQRALPFCVIPITSIFDLQKKPLSWWQSSQTCAGIFQTLQYHYVIESLGEDVCSIVQAQPQAVADYYRITLFAKKNLLMVFLQSTVVVPKKGSKQCEGKSHWVIQGRQMWREY